MFSGISSLLFNRRQGDLIPLSRTFALHLLQAYPEELKKVSGNIQRSHKDEVSMQELNVFCELFDLEAPVKGMLLDWRQTLEQPIFIVESLITDRDKSTVKYFFMHARRYRDEEGVEVFDSNLASISLDFSPKQPDNPGFFSKMGNPFSRKPKDQPKPPLLRISDAELLNYFRHLVFNESSGDTFNDLARSALSDCPTLEPVKREVTLCNSTGL